MDASQVAQADNDPVIKSRLDSCVFKGAVKMDGEWQAVPMCSMNQAMWAKIYEERDADRNLHLQGQPWHRRDLAETEHEKLETASAT
ncbi:MAG: hypothetical protein ACFCU3_07945 [Verrucomicrobiales bacterium]